VVFESARRTGNQCQVGDAAKIRAAEPRKQKHDLHDVELILKLLVENVVYVTPFKGSTRHPERSHRG
jgi:hypothetical protein